MKRVPLFREIAAPLRAGYFSAGTNEKERAMRDFPWLEAVLIIALAVALIVRPKNNSVAASQPVSHTMLELSSR